MSLALLGLVKPFKYDSHLSLWRIVLQKGPGEFMQQCGAEENTLALKPEEFSKVMHLNYGPEYSFPCSNESYVYERSKSA